MTSAFTTGKRRRGDIPEEQPSTPDTAGERELTPDGMSKGKNYQSAPPENQGAFDPASTRTPQGGGPD